MKTSVAITFFFLNATIFCTLVVFGLENLAKYKNEHREEIEAAKLENDRKTQETKQFLEKWADELSLQVDNKKHFIKYQGADKLDAWGKAIKVSYSGGIILSQKLKLISAGVDGEFDTKDDIIVERTR